MTFYRDKIRSLLHAVDMAPEYTEIMPFFVELYRYLEEREGASGITITSPKHGAWERLAHGFPLVSPADIRVDRLVCLYFLGGCIELFRRIGRDGSEDLANIEAGLADGRLDPAQLFHAILERNRAVIEESARSCQVAAPLLEYILEIPLKAALEQFAAVIDATAFGDWQESFCPVCGSRAGMSELAGEEGKRYLCCSTCSCRWQFKRLQCPFCGNAETDKLSYFTVGEGATRVDTCTACSRYIKTRDSRHVTGGIPLDMEDLLTIHLDLLAVKEGFERGK